MVFIVLVELLICTLITYFWKYASIFYIEVSRSFAASAYPGDITLTQGVIYQLFFPITLFGFLCIITSLLYLTFKNKLNLLSYKNKVIYIVPLISAVYTFISLYIYIF